MQDNQVQEMQADATDSAALWVKPDFEVIEVSLECTAYAGTHTTEDACTYAY
jgi:hypothetical protein